MPKSYREILRERQRQEYEDRNESGLGRASLLDFSRTDLKVNKWSPEYGKNEFDILPFVITQEWFKHLRGPSGRPMGLEVGKLWYKLQVPFHDSVGPNNDTWLCLREAFGQECCVCENMFALYKKGKKEEGKNLRSRWRTFYNIYDYLGPDNHETPFQLFDISYYCFEATTTMDPQRANLLEAQMLSDGEIVVFSDLEEGSTIIADFKKKILGKNEFPEVTSISFDPRDPYSEKDLDQVYPLDKMLVVPTVEQVSNSFYGLNSSDENNDSNQENSDNTPSRSRRSRQQTTQTQDEQQATNRDSSSKCPAGGIFGQDCNRIEACKGNSDDSCSEAVFQECLSAYETLSKQSTQEEQTQETSKREDSDTSQRTRRTRGGGGSSEMSKLEDEANAVQNRRRVRRR